MSAVLVASTDTERHMVILTLDGDLLDDGHIDVMRSAAAVLPVGFGLVIDLTSLGSIDSSAIDELRDLARESASTGHQLVFVCGDLQIRTQLVLGDLDALAPVVESIEQALPIARAAA